MSVRRWLWSHPEIFVLGLSAIAWTLLFAPGAQHLPFSMRMASTSTPMRMPDMSPSMHMPSEVGATIAGGWTVPTFTLMVIAMMLPASSASIRSVAARSLWRRRNRAVAVWTLGYAAVWLLGGAAILGARTIALDTGVLHPGALPLVIGLLLAAVWQLTPTKQLALNGCHRTRPLAPSGIRADRDCTLYGLAIGRDCIVSCGPMMAAMTLGTRNELVLMVAITTVVLVERVRRRPPRRASAIALGLLCFAAI
jgi:predicted metal-binding membrane protein